MPLGGMILRVSILFAFLFQYGLTEHKKQKNVTVLVSSGLLLFRIRV